MKSRVRINQNEWLHSVHWNQGWIFRHHKFFYFIVNPVGIKAIFSDNDWKSGQPQRYGWQEEGKEGKTLPREIIQFIERRKPKLEVKSGKHPPLLDKVEDVQDQMDELSKDEPTIQVTKKEKKNDNPKQKNGRTGKRKSKGVAKN